MELMKSLKTMEKEKNAVQENRNLQLLILKAMKDTIKSGDVDAFQEKIIDSITIPQLKSILISMDPETIKHLEEVINNTHESMISELTAKHEDEVKIKKVLDGIKDNNRIETPDNDVLWLEWKSITINLPKFSFTLRVSNNWVRREYLEEHPKFKEEGCEEEYICEMLKAINKYLEECWIETDWDVDYLNRMKAYDYPRRMWSSAAWECINYLMELGDYDEKGYHGDWYWMNGISDNCQEFLCCAWRMFQFQHIGRSRCKVLCKGK